MESKELRVGNLVYESKRSKILRKKIGVEICEIKSLDIHHLESFPESENFEPIPLTEEWLFKFGFEKNENGLFKLFNESEVPILLNEDLDGWTCDGINFSVNGTQYVHQLQNLYFALTGKELTNIK
jgi:hypothetical protein